MGYPQHVALVFGVFWLQSVAGLQVPDLQKLLLTTKGELQKSTVALERAQVNRSQFGMRMNHQEEPQVVPARTFFGDCRKCVADTDGSACTHGAASSDDWCNANCGADISAWNCGTRVPRVTGTHCICGEAEAPTETASTAASTEAKVECTNVPTNSMTKNGKTCETSTWMYTNRCNAPESVNKHRAKWIENKYCQLSCWANGNGYDGDDCEAPAETVQPLLESCPDADCNACEWCLNKEMAAWKKLYDWNPDEICGEMVGGCTDPNIAYCGALVLNRVNVCENNHGLPYSGPACITRLACASNWTNPPSDSPNHQVCKDWRTSNCPDTATLTSLPNFMQRQQQASRQSMTKRTSLDDSLMDKCGG